MQFIEKYKLLIVASLMFAVLTARELFFSQGVIFAWDMIPRFGWGQIIHNSFFAWDPYLQRPNYRAIQSSISLWALEEGIQNISIFMTYFLLYLSSAIYLESLRKYLGYDKRKQIISVIISLFLSSLILVAEGYWYHSLILSISLSFLSLHFSISYLDSGDQRLLLGLAILIIINPMISYNYLVIILLVVLSMSAVFTRGLKYMKAWKLVAVAFTSFLVYSGRVILPILGSTSSIETSLSLEASSLTPFEAFIPLYRISWFFNLDRFQDIAQNSPALFLLVLFPIISLVAIIHIGTKRETLLGEKELSIFLLSVLLLSILSLMGKGYYQIVDALSQLFSPVNILNVPLRKPVKWFLPQVIACGSLISILLFSLFNRENKRYLVYVIILGISIPFSVSPLSDAFSGDLGNSLQPKNFNESYENVKDIVENKKAVYLPVKVDRPSVSISARRTTDELMIYYFDIYSYEAGGFDSYPYSSKAMTLLYSSMMREKNLQNINDILGLEYYIFDESVRYNANGRSPRLFRNDEFGRIQKSLNQTSSLKRVHSQSPLKLYSNSDQRRVFEIKNSLVSNFVGKRAYYQNISSNYALVSPIYRKISNYSYIRNEKQREIVQKGYSVVEPSELGLSSGWTGYKYYYSLGLSKVGGINKKYGSLGLGSYSNNPVLASKANSSISLSREGLGNPPWFLRASGNGKLNLVSNGSILQTIKVQKNDFQSYEIRSSCKDCSLILQSGYVVVDSLLVNEENSKPNQIIRNIDTKYSSVANAKIRTIQKLSPTEYKIRVNSTSPYILTFSESYADGWKARVINSEISYESIPVFSLINGFKIDEKGLHTVKVYYEPQKKYSTSFILTLLILIVLVSWLFLDWRRRKEDEWALRIERKYVEQRDGLKGRGKKKLSSAVQKVK